MARAKRPKATAKVAAKKHLAPSVLIREERAFIKRRDAARAELGFTPNTAPNDFSLDAAIDARMRTYVTEAREAFNASRDASAAIKALGEQIMPLLAEIREELTLHRQRIFSLETHQAKHTARLDDHHDRLTALERVTKGL